MKKRKLRRERERKKRKRTNRKDYEKREKKEEIKEKLINQESLQVQLRATERTLSIKAKALELALKNMMK